MIGRPSPSSTPTGTPSWSAVSTRSGTRICGSMPSHSRAVLAGGGQWGRSLELLAGSPDLRPGERSVGRDGRDSRKLTDGVCRVHLPRDLQTHVRRRASAMGRTFVRTFLPSPTGPPPGPGGDKVAERLVISVPKAAAIPFAT